MKPFYLEKSKVAPNYDGNPLSGVRLAGADYYKNAITNQDRQPAQVLRVLPISKPQAGSWIDDILSSLGFGDESDIIVQQVVARSEFYHATIPDPYPSDEQLSEEEVERRIFAHYTHGIFVQSPGISIPTLAPGDWIDVTYSDVQNRQGGQILGIITSGGPLSSINQSAKKSFEEKAKSNLLAVLRPNGGRIFDKNLAVTENPCLAPGPSITALEAGCFGARTKEQYDKVLNDAFAYGNGKESGFRYKAKPWPGLGNKNATFCNFAVQDMTSKLGVGLPVNDDGRALSANEMFEYFKNGTLPESFDKFKDSNVGNKSWKSFDTPEEAQKAAANGVPVVVGWKNTKGGSGHVAMMRSNGNIVNVGSKNFVDGDVKFGFGDKKVTYFVFQSGN
jgi:hypothetical protein